MSCCHCCSNFSSKIIQLRCGNTIVKTFNNPHGYPNRINKLVETIAKLFNPCGYFVKHYGLFLPVSFNYIHTHSITILYYLKNYLIDYFKNRRQDQSLTRLFYHYLKHLLSDIQQPFFQRSWFYLEG